MCSTSESKCMPMKPEVLHAWTNLEDDGGCNSTSLPPLDEVTVYSEHSDDSLSDISVASGDGSPEDTTGSPRLIFSSYWAKGGRKEPLVKSSLSETVKAPYLFEAAHTGPSVNTYESTLKMNECSHKYGVKESPARRRIFERGCWSQSFPSMRLVGNSSMPHDFRKSLSTSALKPGKAMESCLKRGRFSGELRRSVSDSSDSTVSFSPHVEIKRYEIPSEIWASEGWSDWFA